MLTETTADTEDDMPRAKTRGRLGITVPQSLLDRLERFRDQINISEICAVALDAYVRDLENAEQAAEWHQRAEETVEADPKTAAYYLERGQDLPLPMPLAQELIRLQPHEQAEALRQWRGGTVSAWERLVGESLPFKYPE